MQVLLQQSTLLCLFIFGCAGSSLLLGLLSACSVQASHCSSFFCCGAQALGLRASEVVAPGLSCSVACGIFLAQGSNPCLLHWQVDFPQSHQRSTEFTLRLSPHSSFPCSSHECINIILVWNRKVSDILILILLFMEKLLYLSLWWSIWTGFLYITAYFMSCLLIYVSYNHLLISASA